MPSFSEVLVALPSFRNHVLRQQHSEPRSVQSVFSTRGAFSAFASPRSNTHAVGVGIRKRRGQYIPDEFVLKLFVFDKVPPDTPGLVHEESHEGTPVDVEQLPVQLVRQQVATTDVGFFEALQTFGQNGAAGVDQTPAQRKRFDPVIGGVSISPLGAPFVGTLACFLERRTLDTRELLVLSNNHVLADVNRLPLGTKIVQPGPEVPPFTTSEADVFAALHTIIPVQFPAADGEPVVNRFDAAIANVTDGNRVKVGEIFGGVPYQPGKVIPPRPGMRVVKAGRTTGVTHGTITATHVQGLQVNYGDSQGPRIAIYNDAISIAGDLGQPFSQPGDSGSLIVEENTGSPVALLFAGDGRSTSACELGPLCHRLRAWPV